MMKAIHMDNEQYNHKYIEAKERQAVQHKFSGVSDGVHENRLPPGQVLTDKFSILDLGVRPTREQYSTWSIEFKGLVKKPQTITLADIKQITKDERTLDFHCVTRWSRYDLYWGGILFSKMMERVGIKPEARFVVFHSFDDYTTNVPSAEALGPDVLIAYELEGSEIPPEHGGPVRMIIPTLYGWKSAKFLTGVELLDKDAPGFWEVRGYNNHADPWLEERYS
ncbi:MAG: molybdopterin-dependent oxidoreductase [Patescibacteria group bacterium]